MRIGTGAPPPSRPIPVGFGVNRPAPRWAPVLRPNPVLAGIIEVGGRAPNRQERARVEWPPKERRPGELMDRSPKRRRAGATRSPQPRSCAGCSSSTVSRHEKRRPGSRRRHRLARGAQVPPLQAALEPRADSGSERCRAGCRREGKRCRPRPGVLARGTGVARNTLSRIFPSVSPPPRGTAPPQRRP
jgi:hypothetical protein